MQEKSFTRTTIFWLAALALVATAIALEAFRMTGAQRGRLVGATALLVASMAASALFTKRRR